MCLAWHSCNFYLYKKDSTQGPIIKHGYTLTAEITFEDAIKSIMKFCYENPEHTPIVLSF